jgi:hypothetical protein
MHGHRRKGIPTTRHEPGNKELFLEARPEIALQIPFFSTLYYPWGMRTKGSLATGVLIALGIALIPITPAAAENVIPSSACKVWNQKVVSQDKTYTCVKSGKKLIWNKGVAVVKPALTSTSADAPAVTPTNTPSTTSALETESTGPTCSRNKNALRNC